MNAESIIMLLVSAGLMVYLLYALLRPEKFLNDNQWLDADLRISGSDSGDH